MEWLNYHHLFYFWTVAREGSVSQAGKRLFLTQPTVSHQLRELESSIGERLFEKVGRKLVLTEAGRVVYRYADEIFALGKEMLEVMRGQPTGRPRRLVVGVADVVPKLIAYQILKPALHMEEQVRVVCHEDKPERLLADLSVQGLDIILSDTPVPPGAQVRAYNHLLGESTVTVFGTQDLARAHGRKFPRSLQDAPFLLPTGNTALRRSMDHWFDSQGIVPRIVGEFEDNALLAAFALAGEGLFVFPTVMEDRVRKWYGARALGRIPSVREQFYVISVERKLKHPAVIAISDVAQRKLFT